MDNGKGKRRSGGNTIRLLTIMGLAATAAAIMPAGSARAYTLETLHAFSIPEGTNPQAALVRDSKGNYYGTAPNGGFDREGSVFELVRRHQGTSWDFHVLYNFCAQTGCLDGASPVAPLILDTAGNLYGTTREGGSANNHGTIFRLSPDAKGKRWTLEVLYNFCSKDSSCPEGSSPQAGLTYQGAESGAFYDGVSPLYGVTQAGGSYSYGTAYSLAPANGKWLLHILHAFCAPPACADGGRALDTPIIDVAGNLYGTGETGGVHGGGTVYELSPPVSGHAWNETTLYAFCAVGNCTDGFAPNGRLIADSGGNFYGTTILGGPNSEGDVFKLAPDGTLSVLYGFCVKRSKRDVCFDGSNPNGGVTMDASGRLYGATLSGGKYDRGTAFRLDNSSLETIHEFCSPSDSCSDGGSPIGGLLLGRSGDLFGVAQNGGNGGGGTIFELMRH